MNHSDEADLPEYIPLSRIAKYLQITEQTLRKGRSGPPVRELAKGRWGVLRSEWREYLEGTRVEGESLKDANGVTW